MGVRGAGGDDEARYGELDEIAWHSDNRGDVPWPHPVGAKRAKRVGVARHAGERVGVDGGHDQPRSG